MKQTRYLLLDDRVIARKANAVLRVTLAAKDGRNPLFVEDKPWEVTYTNGYPDVMYDAEARLYKCWHNTWVIEKAYAVTPPHQRTLGTWGQVVAAVRGKRPFRRVGSCYLTSRDGLTWTKGVLNAISFKGSRRNNLVLRDAHGAGVFLDDREPKASRRYKMLFRDDRPSFHVMSVGFSPDGVHWRRKACPEIVAQGDTHNNAFWAPTLGKYVGLTRLWRYGGSGPGVRQVGRTVSDDFDHWSHPRVVFEGLEANLQIYSMPVCFHAGVYLGVPAIFELATDKVWTELAWSPDTVHWHRVDPGRPLIGLSARYGTCDWGCAYASRPVFLDQEIRLYYMGSYGLHTDWRRDGLCLSRLRPDGFAGYEPVHRRKAAVIATKPLSIKAAALRISADVRRGGRIEIVARDARSNVVATSRPIARTCTDTPVRWTQPPPAQGRIKLEFRLRNAKLYSFSKEEA